MQTKFKVNDVIKWTSPSKSGHLILIITKIEIKDSSILYRTEIIRNTMENFTYLNLFMQGSQMETTAELLSLNCDVARVLYSK